MVPDSAMHPAHRGDLLLTECSWRQRKTLRRRCDGEGVIQVSILAPITHQMVVRALFLDDTSIQHNDAVSPFERRDPMGNENDRLMGKVPGQIRKNLSFGGRIKGGCRFIQQKQRRVLKHSTS